MEKTRLWIRNRRDLLVSFCLSLSALQLVLTHHFQGPQLGVAWIFLGLAWALGTKRQGPKWILGCLYFLVGSAYFSVLGSILWGYGDWDRTLVQAIWMTPLLGFYLIEVPRNIFRWWIPVLVVHSSWILRGSLVLGSLRPTGLAEHPGIAGAILVIGILTLLLDSDRKYKLLIPLLFTACILTGSRISLLVLGVVLLGQWKPVWDYFKFRPILGIGISLVPLILLVLVPELVLDGLRLTDESRVYSPVEDIKHRIELTHPLSFTPYGYFHSDGLHSVFTKVATQMGIQTAIVLASVTAFALGKRPYLDSSWWILCTLLLMSTVELYPWLGPLAVIWWIVIGWRTKSGSEKSL